MKVLRNAVTKCPPAGHGLKLTKCPAVKIFTEFPPKGSFKRLGDNNDKIAFKDHKGKSYVLRIKRYFIIDKHYSVEKCNG